MNYIQTADRFSSDAVLLAHFVRPKGKACELCAGGGIISLLLSARYPELCIDALEIDPSAAAIMKENISTNALDGRLRAVCGDLRRSALPAGGYGTVFCNPPYFNSGKVHATRGGARSELNCTLSDVCTEAGRLLNNGGRFFAVYRPERLSSLFFEMKKALIEPKRLCFVRHRPGAAPSAVLVEGRKCGGEGLTVDQDLILCREDGQPTARYKEIYGEFL